MRHGQALAGEQLVLRDHPVVALPVVGDGCLASQSALVEQPAAGRIITSIPVEPPLGSTQHPGHGAPDIHVIGPLRPTIWEISSKNATSCPL